MATLGFAAAAWPIGARIAATEPTVNVAKDGSFELRFIRPGKKVIQLSPFMPPDSPAGFRNRTSVTVELEEDEIREGIELHVASWGEPTQPAPRGQGVSR